MDKQLSKLFLKQATVHVNFPFAVKCPSLGKLLMDDLWTLVKQSPISKITSAYFNIDLLHSEVVEYCLEELKMKDILKTECEATIEIPPSSIITKQKLLNLKSAGINRVCIRPICLSTITTFQPKLDYLFKSINRHFQNVACDILIDEGLSETYICQNLAYLNQMDFDHITIEQTEKSSKYSMHDFNNENCNRIQQYEYICETLEQMNFKRHELCNFAKNKQSVCQHNISLWKGSQFIGIGPGAHGRICAKGNQPFKRNAISYSSNVDQWVKRDDYRISWVNLHPLSDKEVLQELLFLGLRTSAGICNDTWKLANGGVSLFQTFGHHRNVIDIVKNNILQFNNKRLLVAKLPMVDYVLIELFDAL